MTTFTFSEDLGKLSEELRIVYHNLLTSANVLRIKSNGCSTISGDCKQKPLSYYMDNACAILHSWCTYHKLLDISISRIDIRNEESLAQFQQLATLPTNLASLLDEYLIYCYFLINK